MTGNYTPPPSDLNFMNPSISFTNTINRPESTGTELNWERMNKTRSRLCLDSESVAKSNTLERKMEKKVLLHSS